MKVLHTSDWHLGRSLYGRNRYAELGLFLDWLAATIETEDIDILLIAGDVFDSTTPGSRAQELYYRFLNQVSAAACRHIVVIAGNHDSASFLNAPKELLRALNVHVIGSMTDDLEDEVIAVTGKTGEKLNPDWSAIICAVPYLRDKDIRSAAPGETIDDKNRKLVEGIRNHYHEVVSIAEEHRRRLSAGTESKDLRDTIPIIAMGHLFAAGGKTVDGDGVRELYVGSLAHISTAIFPQTIDYLALGHLHVPQAVGGQNHIRYCGSPIPIGFGEADQQKKIVVVEFGEAEPAIRELPIPCFQELIRIKGSIDLITQKISDLKDRQSRGWLEIEYIGNEIVSNLRERIEDAVAGTDMEVRRIGNRQLTEGMFRPVIEEEALEELDPADVFERCLDSFDIPAEERADLKYCYQEVIIALLEEDTSDK